MFMLSNRHHDSYKLDITYRSTHVKRRQVLRLCYPIHIMTATNWNNLQIYQCKNQVGGTFMLSNRYHDSYKLA